MTPEITYLSDVTPYIEENDGIIVARRDGYMVVDYSFVTDSTFTNPVALECRGLKFDDTGRILARPFHKFFNIGEKEPPETVDWSRPHLVLDKLDGSMVHPCLLNGELTFMTRKGVSRQAEAALAASSDAVQALCRDALARGITPLFEFTSPDNRVVLEYDRTDLTLLAARDTITGQYMPMGDLTALANRYGVAVVNSFGHVEDFRAFIAQSRALDGIEGYVVAFENGHRLKLKTDGYALRHKALSGVAHEKNLLAWVARDALDDVLPILHKDIAERAIAYRDQVMAAAGEHLSRITDLVAANGDLDRRDFAITVQSTLDKRLQNIAFALRDGKNGHDAMRALLIRASHSDPRVEQYRDLFGMKWSTKDVAPDPE